MSIIDEIEAALAAAKRRAKKTAHNVARGAGQAVEGVGRAVLDKGEDVLEGAEGLARGVVSKAGDVVEGVQDFGEDVVEGAQDFGRGVRRGVGQGVRIAQDVGEDIVEGVGDAAQAAGKYAYEQVPVLPIPGASLKNIVGGAQKAGEIVAENAPAIKKGLLATMLATNPALRAAGMAASGLGAAGSVAKAAARGATTGGAEEGEIPMTASTGYGMERPVKPLEEIVSEIEERREAGDESFEGHPAFPSYSPAEEPAPAADPQLTESLFRKAHGGPFDPKSSMDKRKMAEIEQLLAEQGGLGDMSANQFALKLYRQFDYV